MKKLVISRRPAAPPPWIAFASSPSPHLQRARRRSRRKEIDEWHRIYLEGKPAGYLRMVSTPREGGGTWSGSFKAGMKRGSTVIETEVSSSRRKTPRGSSWDFKWSKSSPAKPWRLPKGRRRLPVMIDTCPRQGGEAEHDPVDPSAVDTSMRTTSPEPRSRRRAIPSRSSSSARAAHVREAKGRHGKEVPVDFWAPRAPCAR